MELYTFTELVENLSPNEPKALFVFDVDLVITMAKDLVFHPLTFQRHQQHLDPLVSVLGEEQEEMMYSLIAADPERTLVENTFPDVLKAIYDHGHHALALTAQLTYSYEGIDNIERRLQELKGFGIDFSRSFPEIAPFEFTNGVKNFGTLPYYREGVIFSNGLINPKGKVLKEFFEATGHLPQKVIFVDDVMNNVVSVREVMLDMGVNCEAYHYKGIEQVLIPAIAAAEAKKAWKKTIERALVMCANIQN
ncbi:MAG: DUF2608 domain-containing protein [Parachlamydiales bacterium]|jgi:hypothetical protein